MERLARPDIFPKAVGATTVRAFATHEEAEKVLDYWRSHSHNSPMAIRTLPVYATATEWAAAGAVDPNGVPTVPHVAATAQAHLERALVQ